MENGELKGEILGVRIGYREFKGENGELGMGYGELKVRYGELKGGVWGVKGWGMGS